MGNVKKYNRRTIRLKNYDYSHHIHGIINVGAGTSPAPTLGEIVGSFKSLCIHKCVKNQLDVSKLWQRNYYEHVIRGEKELKRIREYIHYNPLKWNLDIENPINWESGKINIDKYYKNIFEGRVNILEKLNYYK